MNLDFNQFNKASYPYLDDSDIDKYVPVLYGKVAAIELTCINKNYDPDNSSVAAVFRMPDGMSDYGNAYIYVDDTWKTANVSNVDYKKELITISNGRSDSGSTYELKIVDCYGYMFDGHCYPRQAMQHWYATYGKIQYTDSNFNKTEFEAELDSEKYKADFGLYLDDYAKDEDSETSYELSYFNKVVYNISVLGGLMYTRVYNNASDKVTARLKDYERTATDTISSTEIKNRIELKGSTTADKAYTKIIEKYYHDIKNDTYLSFEDNTYENFVKQNYRVMQSKTDKSYLVNKADALKRAAWLALEFKNIPVVFTVDVYKRYTARLYDVYTISLQPDNLSENSRVYAGNHDCLVLGVKPMISEKYTELTVMIIPDRTASVQQASVRSDSYTTVTRAKSTAQIITDNLSEEIDNNLLLTGNIAPQQINVVADTAGTVSDFSAAAGTFYVKYNGNDITGNGPVYSVVSQTGCTGTIDEATGMYAITALSADVGILLLKATYEGKSFETSFTVTKSYTGNMGVTVSLVADNSVISYNSSGTTPSPASASLTATLYNYTGTVYYEFVVDGTTAQNTISNTYAYTAKASYTDMPDNIIVKVRAGTSTGTLIASDAVDMIGIKDATDGTSATSVLCGNENQSIACSSDGLTDGAQTVTIPFAGYIGASRAACTIAYSTLPSGMTLSSNTAATTSADGSLVFTVADDATLGGASVTKGTITLTFTCNSLTFIKIFNWTKTIAGATGTSGRGISSTTVTYQAGTSGTTAPTGTWTSAVPTVAEGQYLWTKIYIVYTDATNSTSYSVAYIPSDGDDGTGISSTVVTYQLNTSGTTAPTGTWTSAVPTLVQGQYLWSRTVITYTDATTSTGYSVSYIATNGTNGTNGTRTASIEMYKWSSSAPTIYPSGTSTYTWATGAFTNPATLNDWSQTIGTGTAGQTLYRVRAVYADTNTTATSSITWPTTPTLETVSNYATDGSDGVDGVNGTRTAILEVYKWASATPTSFPSGTSTYTWADGTFTAPTTANGWSISPGASTAGYTLYACQMKYADALTTATSTVTWSTSTAYAVGAAGSDAVVYSVEATAMAINKSALNVFTPATVTFSFYKTTGSVKAANSNYYKISGSNDGSTWTVITSGTTAATSAVLTPTTSYTQYKCEQYLTYSASTFSDLKDSETVSVVSDGTSAMTYTQQNASQSVPSDSSGTVTSYTGTGNIIRVFEGSTELQAVTGTPTAGQYKVVAAGTDITAGAVTVSGLTAVVAVSSGMTAGTSTLKATVTYTITGVRANGTAFSTTLTQSITKAVAGVNLGGNIIVADPTSTTPESTMEYNKTYYNITNGVTYQWSWTSTTTGVWAQVSAEYPTNIAVRYSFDEMPDLPDDSGAIYKVDYGEFTSTAYWTAYNGVITLVGGFIVNTVTATAHNTIFNKSVSIASKLVKIQFKVSANATGNTSLIYNNGSNIVLKQLNSLTAGTIYTFAVLVPSDATGTAITLNINGSTTGSTVTVLDFYIGDGTTTQPIIDNISGSVNATGSGVVSVPGVSGKACQFVGLKAIQLDLSKYANVQSWWTARWIYIDYTNSTVNPRFWQLGNKDYCFTDNGSSSGTGYINVYTYNGTNVLGGSISRSLLMAGLHHVVVQTTISSSSSAVKKLYIDGVLTNTWSSTADFTSLTFGTGYIGGSSLTTSLMSGYQDDWCFGVGKITAAQVLGLYLDCGAHAKLYSLADYKIDSSITSYSVSADNSAFTKSRAGVVSPSTITVSAKAVINEVPTAYAGWFIIYTTTDGTNWSSVYPSTANESSHKYTIASGISGIKVELYKAGGTTALVATQTYDVPYAADVAPQYMGIGILTSTSTKAFTGATVADDGTITPGNTVSNVITGDWMVGYVISTMIATVYYWNGTAWTATTDQKYVSAAAFDIMNLTTGGYTVANYTVIMNAIIKNLMVSNLKLLTGGKLFAGNGNFYNADTPIFLGYDTDGVAKFSLGNNFYASEGNASFTGDVLSNRVRLQNDCFMPMVEFAQIYDNYTNFDINLSTATESAIKTAFDNLISNDSIASRIDYNDSTQLRSYIYITSNDSDRPNVAEYSMSDYYIQRYIDTMGITYYRLGSVSSNYGSVNTTRLLLSVSSSGTITKYTSSTLSNNLHFSYRAKEFGINAAGIFVGGTIESRKGYKFYEPSWYGSGTGTRTYTGAEYFKYLKMLGVDSTPRLCCIHGDDSSYPYHIGVVYLLSSTLYRIEKNSDHIDIDSTGTTDTGIRQIMI